MYIRWEGYEAGAGDPAVANGTPGRDVAAWKGVESVYPPNIYPRVPVLETKKKEKTPHHHAWLACQLVLELVEVDLSLLPGQTGVLSLLRLARREEWLTCQEAMVLQQ